MTRRWLNLDRLLSLTEWSERTIQQKAKDGSLCWRHAQRRNKNGRLLKEYDLLSLPPELQAKHAKLAPPPSEIENKSAPAQIVLFAPKNPTFEPMRLPVSEEHREQIDSRVAIISPFLDYLRLKTETGRRDWCFANGFLIGSADSVAKQIGDKHGVGRSTIWRWVKVCRSKGAAELFDKARSDKGQSRWAVRNEEAAQIAVFAYIDEKLSKRMSWEIARDEALKMGLEPPSYETVRVLLENIPAPIKTLALKGRRKYDEIFAPYIRRGYTDFEAGEILVSDHAIHDVIVQDDLFDKDRRHMRLRFTGLLDMRSRKFESCAWSQEGSSRSITTCLRNAIGRFGAPRLMYVDNGLDFQKVGRGARSSAWKIEEIAPEALGVLARLGIEVQYCLKFHPQSKLIERANNTLHQRFDRCWPTYTGPSPDKRPDRCIAALERHKRLLAEGRPDESDLPLASEFIRAALVWIEGDYHETEKDVAGMDGLTPNEAFERFRWTKRKAPPKPAELAILLADQATRTVQECAITIDGRRYEPVDEAGYQMMHYWTGKSVSIVYDKLDPDCAAAIDADGSVIAYLRPERLSRQSNDEETRSMIAESMRLRNGLRRDVREQIEHLGRSVRSTGYVTQHEKMLQIGRLPIDISGVVVRRPDKPRLQSLEEADDSPVPGEAAERLAARLQGRKCVNS